MTVQPADSVPAESLPSFADTTEDGLARLGRWVAAAKHAHDLVRPLVGTAFVPEAYRPEIDPRATDQEKQTAFETAVATATAAVLQGISLGLDPLTALQQIYIVHGRPGMYSKMMVALVQSMGHEVWTEESTDSRCVVAGRRHGSQQIERVTITMDQARRAGWVKKNKSYELTPADMLWARASGRVCDRIGSDVLKGLRTVEDITDEHAPEPVQASTRTVNPRRSRRASITAATEPAAASAPDATPRSTPDQVPAPSDDILGYGQSTTPDAPETAEIDENVWRRINARLNELRVTGDGQQAARLAIIGQLTGHQVSRGSELTAAEGQQVLQQLADDGPEIVWAVLGDTFGHTDPSVPAIIEDEVPPADGVEVMDPPTDGSA